MMDKTCGNCKFRGESIHNSNARLPDVDYGFNDKGEWGATGYNDTFLCDRIKLVSNEVEKVFVADASGYFAALCVSDDFGCNKWESKEGE